MLKSPGHHGVRGHSQHGPPGNLVSVQSESTRPGLNSGMLSIGTVTNLGLPFSPVTSGSSESGNSAFSTNASPWDDDYVLRLCKTLPEICHIWTDQKKTASAWCANWPFILYIRCLYRQFWSCRILCCIDKNHSCTMKTSVVGWGVHPFSQKRSSGHRCTDMDSKLLLLSYTAILRPFHGFLSWLM